MKVKKEATVAVVIGLLLALLVAGGILRARYALQSFKFPTKKVAESTPINTGDAKNGELFLDLTTPDNSVTKFDKLTLSGKTLPSTYIAILGEKGEYLIVPNDLGSFSQDITLVKGANTVKITIYQDNGNKLERTVNAVYTTAEI